LNLGRGWRDQQGQEVQFQVQATAHPRQEIVMFRKSLLALAAVAALGTAALAPTSASAWHPKHGGWHGHHHGHHGWHRGVAFGVFGPAYAYGGCVMKKRWVDTPYGTRLRWVRVCY